MKILSISDIIKTVVDQITPKFVIDSITANSDGTYTLTSCDTFYLIPCKTITIAGEEYEIKSFIQDESITIKPVDSGDPTGETEFDLYLPFYIHGSPINTNNELTEIQFSSEKTPTVYLYETLREKHHEKLSGSPIALESDVVIFFLDESNWQEWKPEDHHNNVIEPMKSLVGLFVDEINRQRANFARIDDFETIERANFGALTKEGVLKSQFNDRLSGVELRISIQYKQFICKSSCINS